MAAADLAIFLDGNGHVITRDAGEMFALPPLLRSIVEQLTGAHVLPDIEMPGQDTDEQTNQKYTPEAKTGSGRKPRCQREQTVTSLFMRVIPDGFLVGFIPTTLIAAAANRFPGKSKLLCSQTSYFRFISLTNKNIRYFCCDDD